RPDWRGLAASMLNQTRVGDGITISPIYQRVVLEYYLRDQLPLSLDLGGFADGTLRPTTSVQMSSVSRLWVVKGGKATADNLSLQTFLDTHYPSLLTQNFGNLQVKLYQFTASK